MQLMFFKKDSATYCDNFLKNCGFKLEDKEKYFQMGTFEELEELLYYLWSEEKMEILKKKNIKIETYLGENDLFYKKWKSQSIARLDFYDLVSSTIFCLIKGDINSFE